MAVAGIEIYCENFKKLHIELQNEKFLFSCISEGLLPEGLRYQLNLARDVNDVTFVNNVEGILNEGNSRLLDVVYQQTKDTVKDFSDKVADFESNLVLGNIALVRRRAKQMCDSVIWEKQKTLMGKLVRLRVEKNRTRNFQKSGGSRKISGACYVKEKDKPRGAPFPVNLRLHRRHRKKTNHNLPPNQSYIPTPEELSLRDPIVLTQKEGFVIPEAGKELCRMGPKTCPTPTTPVDELAQQEAWLKWREGMRWAWLFNKEKRPDDVEQNFIKQPWYRKTDKKAPRADDCPELEAFIAAVGRDVSDPNLRRPIKDNLTPEMRQFIKEVREDYPRENLRVRMEDKGSRFVVTDGETEDNLIKNDLENTVHYKELDIDPKYEYAGKVREWADRGLRTGEITEEMHGFVTNPDNNENARPKPVYKTHKTDDEGNLQNPVPIRNITVGTGTVVHALSKLCQMSLEHLTTEEHLPRMDKSTKAVLRRFVFMNENSEPLSISAVLALADIKSMYPNTDLPGALETVRQRAQQHRTPLGLSAEYLVEGLKLCLECNCVAFDGKFYIPCRGCAQGTCHACHFTDLWIGDITLKHTSTSNVSTENFSIYRDDGKDIIEEKDIAEYTAQLNSLHPNLKWDVRT